MLVPKVNDINIINNKIVFNDSVLPLKDEDSTLKLSTIENVNQYSLERCIKTIFEHNLDATFHTVQYSKANEKVYFYADRLLEKKEWYDISTTKHKPLNSEKEILQEIKNVLNLSINKNSDCISLYEISNLLLIYNKKFDDFKKEHENAIVQELKKEYSSCNFCSLFFKYPWRQSDNDHSLDLTFWPYDGKKCETTFIKKNNSLTIKKSNNDYYDTDILKLAGDIISGAYDGYLKFYDFKNQHKTNIKPINSNFYVSISDSFVIIKDLNKFLDDTTNQIYASLSNTEHEIKYRYKTKNNNIISICQNNEKEIFKRIFVKIEDCPKWMQEELFCRRQNELTEERQTNQQSEKEPNPQKKLSIKNFFKKQ